MWYFGHRTSKAACPQLPTADALGNPLQVKAEREVPDDPEELQKHTAEAAKEDHKEHPL